ncbi:MAG: FHA domain-containing protein [Myxococcota bacterium]
MRDGRTRKLEVTEHQESFETFLAGKRAVVVVLSGEAAGTEYEIRKPNLSVGRAEPSDWIFEDDTLSKEHAALEYVEGTIRLRDLGSMNGTLVNGTESKSAELKNGDRFQLGQHQFQFVLEDRRRGPKTYVVES